MYTRQLTRFVNAAEKLPLPAICLAVLLLGLAARVVIMQVVGFPASISWAEVEKIAKSLAENGTFANPYSVETGPTAHHAPVYPYLLSFIYRFLGYTQAAIVAQTMMNLVFAAAAYALVPVLVHTAQLRPIIGIAAGCAGALFPLRILKESRWEASLTAAVLVVLAIAVTYWWQQRPDSRAYAALTGGLAALATLTSAPVLFVSVFIGLAALHVLNRNARLMCVVAYSLTFCSVLMPWVVRNYFALGAYVPVRSNFGLEFSLSNHDTAYVQAADNVNIGFPNNYFHLNHPWSNRAQAERVRAMGEPAYNRMRLRESLQWCRQNASQFVRLTVGRMLFFWFPRYPARQWFKIVPAYTITVLAFFGLYRMVRLHLPAGIFFACLWIGFPMVYYVVQMDTRYRFPLDWSELVLAAYAAASLVAHSRSIAPRDTALSRGAR